MTRNSVVWIGEGRGNDGRSLGELTLSSANVSNVSSGIKHEWQVNGLEDIQDRSTLAEKLGGNTVVSLEGSPL